MAVAKELVWTHVKSTYAGDAVVLTQYREMMWRVSEFIKTAGATVVSSCNGTGGGNYGNNDNVDWWVDSGDLVWAGAGSNHSWIVFKFLERYLCIDLRSTNSYNAAIVASDSKFYGGTATARPTSTSARSVLLLANADPGVWCSGQSAANKQFQIHGMYQANGMRLFISSGGVTGSMLLWENPTDVRGCHYPALMTYAGGTSAGVSGCTIALLNTVAASSVTSTAVTELALEPAGGWSTTQVKFAARDQQADDYYNGWNIEIIAGTRDGDQRVISDYVNATNEATVSVAFGAVLSATSEYMLHRGVLSAAMGACYLELTYANLGTEPAAVTSADDWDATWPFSTVRLISAVTGHRWCRGRVQDLYWGPSANANGQLFDTDLTRDWVQYGNLVVPNDGDPAPVT
jgi:hypothetical protein